jgi:hypothetical protein
VLPAKACVPCLTSVRITAPFEAITLIFEVPDASAIFLVPQCYVSRVVLTCRLTSEISKRKKPTVMITAIRKPLDTRTAAGCYSPTSAHALRGQFIARVEGIEL